MSVPFSPLRGRHVRLLALIASLSVLAAHAQGFSGMTGMKTTANLRRKLPAIFTLTQPDIKVNITSVLPNAAPLTAQLVPQVEAMMQQSDHRIVTGSAHPKTVIECTIIGYVPPKVQLITTGSAVQTKQGTVPPRQYQKVTGSLTVAYRAKDIATGKPLDAAVLTSKINQDYEKGGEKSKSAMEELKGIKGILNKDRQAEEVVPGPEEVNERMVHEIAVALSRRVVNTDETVQVLLARGKLDGAGKQGVSGNWPRMLDDLTGMQPLPGKDKDAYRQYDIGVAYEAMGYSATDPEQAIKLFQLAATNYGLALDNAPEEKYFREPQNRIESALLTMKTINERAKGGGQPTGAELAETSAVEPAPEAKPQPKGPPNKAEVAANSDVLTNEQIISLASHGMDDDNLIDTVQDAKEVKFDLSGNGLNALMTGKVSNKVIAAMRQKQRGVSAAAAAQGAPARKRPAGAARP